MPDLVTAVRLSNLHLSSQFYGQERNMERNIFKGHIWYKFTQSPMSCHKCIPRPRQQMCIAMQAPTNTMTAAGIKSRQEARFADKNRANSPYSIGS